MGTPLVVAKARAFPLSSELIEVVVSVLKIEATRIIVVTIPHLPEIAQSCDLRLSIGGFSYEEQYEE